MVISQIKMFLMKHGFNIVQYKLQRDCGYIDLIVERGGELHFFEIQTVLQETFERDFKKGQHIRPQRMCEIEKTAQLFMREIGSANAPWHIHAIFIIILKNNKTPKIKINWDANL